MEKKLDISDYKTGMKLKCLESYCGFYKGNIYTVFDVSSVTVWVKDDNGYNWPFSERDTVYNLTDYFEKAEERKGE